MCKLLSNKWTHGKNHELPEDGPELKPKYFGVTINT